MHHKASPRQVRGETAVQRAVLALTLAADPEPLTIPNIAREIDAGNAAEVAIRELVNVGLLVCGGISIRPSRAALHFDRLGL